ncbi:PE-PPE domain-containing protein [Mycobacterium sp. GA-1285]|uniref:PE-PPE domain-containing protein n=1 Tax=Mycobacterium sp. GA-1285 TaxID=1772282 RepID=UPI000B007FBF|nr:PE-PPE domain-containing protein [Mycobacterium sp. GA-1285]
MAAKHRRSSRASAVVARVLGPGGLAAAAVGVTSVSTALMTGTTTAVAPAVDLVALVTPANSTSQIFAGTTYYGTDWTTVYGEQHVVPFFLGPQGIKNAIIEHRTDPEKTGVVSSGWGAGQTGTALKQMSDSEKDNVAFVILDNNTNRAGGGFWTTYAPFAPLLATSAEPTSKDLGVPALDVAYEYNINSDAPVDPLNPFAVGNSLAAYLYGYGAQSNTVIPDEVMKEALSTDPNTEHYAYVIDSQGNILNKQKLPGSRTTYVTVQSENLPLTRPLRLLPGGNIVADAIDPTVTQLVNAGYNDGKGLPGHPAIPKDPTVTRPMQPGSSLTALSGGQVSTLDERDAGSPTAVESGGTVSNLTTDNLDEADNSPVVASQSRSTPTSPPVSGSTVQRSSPNKFAPKLPGEDRAPSNGSSAIGRNGLNDFADRVNDTVNRVTSRLTGAKPSASDGAKSNDTPSTK